MPARRDRIKNGVPGTGTLISQVVQIQPCLYKLVWQEDFLSNLKQRLKNLNKKYFFKQEVFISL